LLLFTELPRETVWKILMGFALGSHEAVKRGEKPPYCRFCATKNTPSRPLRLFTKQFQKAKSQKLIFTILDDWPLYNGELTEMVVPPERLGNALKESGTPAR